MKKVDFIIIVTLLLLAALMLLVRKAPEDGGSMVTVYKNGKQIGSYPLSEDRDIVIEGDGGDRNVISIKDGSAYMKEASCTNHYCMTEGRISSANESICCAPNGIIAVIDSEDKGDYDAITY